MPATKATRQEDSKPVGVWQLGRTNLRHPLPLLPLLDHVPGQTFWEGGMTSRRYPALICLVITTVTLIDLKVHFTTSRLPSRFSSRILILDQGPET